MRSSSWKKLVSRVAQRQERRWTSGGGSRRAQHAIFPSSGMNSTSIIAGSLVAFTTAAAGLYAWKREEVAATLTAFAEETESSQSGFAKYKDANLPVDFCEKIEALLGTRFVLTKAARENHSHDFSYHAPNLPEAVLFVATAEEVAECVRLCNEYKVPVIPFGSGTSLEGHIIPETQGAVSLNLRALNQVIELHEDDLDVVVQPGMTYAELNQYLKPHGLFFPLDPGPGASIGGMINTSCSGPNAVRYGTAKENVLALKVVTPDGKIIKTRSRAKKSSAGYDLTHLFVGSEGTLGVVVEATLRLQRIPSHKSIALCTFDTVTDAAHSVIEMVKKNIRIGKVELLDDVCMKSVNIWSQTHYTEKATLLFEFSGSELEVDEQIKATRSITAAFKGGEFKYANTEAEREELWRARKEALWAAPVLQEGSSVLITDACVPISHLAKCLEETQVDIQSSGLYAPMVAHAGDGNFHLFVVFDKNRPEQVAAAADINEKLVKRAIAMDGTCTGEHGVGSGKRKFLVSELGENAIELMRTLKESIDPNGIMNPHKVIPDKAQPDVDPHGSGPSNPFMVQEPHQRKQCCYH